MVAEPLGKDGAAIAVHLDHLGPGHIEDFHDLAVGRPDRQLRDEDSADLDAFLAEYLQQMVRRNARQPLPRVGTDGAVGLAAQAVGGRRADLAIE